MSKDFLIRLVEAATRDEKTSSQAVEWFFEFVGAVDAYRGPCRVYFISAPATHLIKIGRSTKPYKRLSQLRLLSPVPLEVVATIPGGGEIESMLHDYFNNVRSHGEWFHATKGLVSFIAEAAASEWSDKTTTTSVNRVSVLWPRSLSRSGSCRPVAAPEAFWTGAIPIEPQGLCNAQAGRGREIGGSVWAPHQSHGGSL